MRPLLRAAKSRVPEPVHEEIERFLSFVWDLPASERHHHARPWGLLDHSLEVAIYAADTARSSATDLVLPAFLTGLTHDIGKVLGLTVRSKFGSVWDPWRHGLESFYMEEGSDPCSVQWVRGRGACAHMAQGARLLPRVLAHPPAPSREVSRIVWLADRRSTGEDLHDKIHGADILDALSHALHMGWLDGVAFPQEPLTYFVYPAVFFRLVQHDIYRGTDFTLLLDVLAMQPRVRKRSPTKVLLRIEIDSRPRPVWAIAIENQALHPGTSRPPSRHKSYIRELDSPMGRRNPRRKTS